MNRIGIVTLVTAAGLALSPFALAAGHLSNAHPEQRGTVRSTSQSYLGIDVRDVGDDQVTTLKLKDTHGAEIIRVDHDAPAGKMGLREHDVVLQMNGVTIDDDKQLRRMMSDCPPGKMVVMVIARDGQTLTTSAAMADRAQIEHQVWLRLGTPTPNGPQAPDQALPTGDATVTSSGASNTVPASRYSRSFLSSLLTSPTYTGCPARAHCARNSPSSSASPAGAGLLVSQRRGQQPRRHGRHQSAGDVVVRANSKKIGHFHERLGQDDPSKTSRASPVAVVSPARPPRANHDGDAGHQKALTPSIVKPRCRATAQLPRPPDPHLLNKVRRMMRISHLF